MFGHDEYDCYFDGSYSHEMCGVSGCAFCVFNGEGELLYEHVEYLRVSSSTSAEKSALYLLLDYIKDNIKIGSTVSAIGSFSFNKVTVTVSLPGNSPESVKGLQ